MSSEAKHIQPRYTAITPYLYAPREAPWTQNRALVQFAGAANSCLVG